MDELREAFDKAYENIDAEEELEQVEVEQETSPVTESETTDAESTESTENAPGKEPGEDVQTAPEKAPVNNEAQAPIKEKAPASWSAKAREAWGKLPAEAQAEVMKREREVNKVLQETAGARNVVTQLNSVLAPYKDGMIASGMHNPMEAIGTMLATESRLRAGSAQEKAYTVANLIKNYGVNIQELDNILSGQGYANAPSVNTDPRIEQLIEQRMAPVNQFLQMQKQQQYQQQQYEQQQAAQTVSTFAERAEFINEVRMDMADLLDMAAARGQPMSIEDAYKKACAIHPEVSSIMAQREKERAMMGNQSEIMRKKTAASSINGLQRSPQTSKNNESLRSTIANIWDESLSNI